MGETWYVAVSGYSYVRNGRRVVVPHHFRYQPWHSRETYLALLKSRQANQRGR